MSKPQLRSSQIVTTFGPGAMVDLPDDSVIVAGLDHWRYDPTSIPLIEEPRLIEKLQNLLGVTGLALRPPPPAIEQTHGFTPDITAWRFPEWFIVQHTVFTKQGYRARRLVHLNSLENGKFRDPDGKRQAVVPVRFVRACPKGHVGDIAWKEFAHGAQTECIRDMWLEERGTSGDLNEIWVRCECGLERPMSQAARMNLRALGSCNGARPWLGPGTREACHEPNRLLIRSASNAYFPQLMSVISIPDVRQKVEAVVKSLWEDFLSDVETLQDLQKMRNKPTVRVRLEGCSDEQVLQAVQRIRTDESSENRPVKEAEFEALTEAREELGSDAPDGVFFARALPRPSWNQLWMAAVERVVLVHRLREVVAQVSVDRRDLLRTAQRFPGSLAGGPDSGIAGGRVLRRPRVILEPLHQLSAASLRALAASLRDGPLSAGVSRHAVEQIAGPLAPQVAECLDQLASTGMQPAHLAVLAEAIANSREQATDPATLFDLVLSGPDVPGIPTSDMAAIPSLRVRMCLDIQRPYSDTSMASEVVRRFGMNFRAKHWPWPQLPELYYDPRSLAEGTAARSSLHAKCIVVDRRVALVTSANFTEAAQYRNIEAGVLVRHPPFAERLTAYFETLVAGGSFTPCRLT